MIKTNQLYIQLAQSIDLCDRAGVSFENLSKLSLFKPKQSKHIEENEQHLFTGLLSSVEKPIYFLKKENDRLICWEVFGESSILQTWLKDKIDDSCFDFLRWPDKHLDTPKLLVFDMDSTFIQIEVIDELARQHGVGDSVSKVTEAAMRGEIDFSQSLISRVACLKGLAESTIEDIASNLPLSTGVGQLVKQSQLKEVKIAIVSGGFTPFVQRLKDKMGLLEVRANNLAIAEQTLTGKVTGQIVDAQVKADFVNELRVQLGIDRNDILTIGDGANDLLMMKESGYSLAYRAKPAVQAQAKGRMNHTTLDNLLDIFGWRSILEPTG